MLNINNLAIKSKTFYRSKNPFNRDDSSSSDLDEENPRTPKIELGGARIDCEILSLEDTLKPINEVQLTHLQENFFVPVNVIFPNSKVIRVLLSIDSFLTHCAKTETQRAQANEIFSSCWEASSLQRLQEIFCNCFQLEILKGDEKRVLATPKKKSKLCITLAREQLLAVGSPKNPKSPNTSDTDLIARTVMRHPKQEVRDLLNKLHTSIKEKFGNLPVEDLEFLLKGDPCDLRPRGGFRNGQSLQIFLNQDSSTIPNSRLITGIETLLTTIAYVIIHRQLLRCPPTLTEAEERVHTLCSKFNPFRVPRIDISYPDRHFSYKGNILISDITTSNKKIEFNSQTEFLIDRRQEISDGSDTDSPSNALKNCVHVMRKYQQSGKNKTWAAVARDSKVPLCCSTSGTVPLIFSVAEWLLSNEAEPQKTSMTEQDKKLLAGALAIPTYIRGDYHSVAETTAGFYHYLVNSTRNEKEPITHVLRPKEALRKGLDLMSESVEETFKSPIEIISKRILSTTSGYEKYTPDETLL